MDRGYALDYPFRDIQHLFPASLKHLMPKIKDGNAFLYNLSTAFFSRVAVAMMRLGKKLAIEVIAGDGFAIMDNIRSKMVTRREDFPATFDRIHASNVPDYA
jgi:hypothetical protein